jgi:hypothetical protein
MAIIHKMCSSSGESRRLANSLYLDHNFKYPKSVLNYREND